MRGGRRTMAETVQVNIRVPEEAKVVITRLGFRLRKEPEFLERLTLLVDGLAEVDVAERLARIEARLAILEAKP